MNSAAAARVANRRGRPNTDFTEKCASSLPRADSSLKGPDVDAEFLGQLIERQQFLLPLVMGDGLAGTLQHHRRDDSSPAVPWPEAASRVTTLAMSHVDANLVGPAETRHDKEGSIVLQYSSR